MRHINYDIIEQAWALERKADYGRKFLPNGTTYTIIQIVDKTAIYRQLREVYKEKMPYDITLTPSISDYMLNKKLKQSIPSLFNSWIVWRTLGAEDYFDAEKRATMSLAMANMKDDLTTTQICEAMLNINPDSKEFIPRILEFEEIVDNIIAEIELIYQDATLIHTIDYNVAKRFIGSSTIPLWSALPDTSLISIETNRGTYTSFLTQAEHGSMVITMNERPDMNLNIMLNTLGIDGLEECESKTNKYAMLVKNKIYSPHNIMLKGIVDFEPFTLFHFDKIITTDDYFAERVNLGYDEPTVHL